MSHALILLSTFCRMDFGPMFTTQQTRDVKLMLAQCWASVALVEHRVFARYSFTTWHRVNLSTKFNWVKLDSSSQLSASITSEAPLHSGANAIPPLIRIPDRISKTPPQDGSGIFSLGLISLRKYFIIIKDKMILLFNDKWLQVNIRFSYWNGPLPLNVLHGWHVTFNLKHHF